jgi:8-oxo-dGTP pyrophosphatase MutT (NUDIX family)
MNSLLQPDIAGVGALMYTRDHRFLMQLRDDLPEVSMGGHWGVFGGRIEESETPLEALIRELHEELSFSPRQAPDWFSAITYSLQFAGHGIHHKNFYAIPIEESDVAAMKLGEGEEMKLLPVAEILSLSNVLPWDAFGVRTFWQRAQITGRLRRRR